MRKMYVFVDDVRPAPRIDENLFVMITCRTYETVIDVIQYFHTVGQHMVLDLDHDLGGTKTGYDISKFLVENEIHVDEIRIHSMNPVGVANMKQLLSHYGYTVIPS